jgi:CRP-like cAMP-binding protein
MKGNKLCGLQKTGRSLVIGAGLDRLNTTPSQLKSLEETTLCYFSKEDLKKILLNISKLTFDFMLFYADELSESETRVRKLAQMSVRERVIDALLLMDAKFGSSEGFLNISLSRKDYADYSGTTEEQVIRILSTLKKEGLINAKRRKLGILDERALQDEISKHIRFPQ